MSIILFSLVHEKIFLLLGKASEKPNSYGPVRKRGGGGG